MTNPKLTELASLLDGACTSPEVEKAAMVIVGELAVQFDLADGRWRTAVECLNEYRERAWKAEDALEARRIADLAADTEQSNAR